MSRWIAFWNILFKDMRTYYLKPPNISWGIIFPLAWTGMFFIKSGSGMESVLSLLPGVVTVSILFGTTSMLAVTVTFEKTGRSFDRLLLAPLPLEMLMLAKTSGAILFGIANAFVPVILALFLTVFIMTPVFSAVNTTAIKPYMAEQINAEEALLEAAKPVRAFMFKQTREKDLELFLSLAKTPKPKNKEEVSTAVLIPAFMISELKTAFTIGFVLFLPFLIIDMVVASILLSMGMMMLPPVMVSLPFKLLLFVLVDGWYLIVGSLVKSFGV
ncbi:MAG: flagellar biosynthetic protein FliP [Deltaproteobacteria bacterium HGW-Deltaproteobacteria-21]|nr:MAG: flagellar biosynthetic protein FliP [Deltaproteobacteria bacterium HGW-Deltaproteobacteria-21]